MGIYVNPGNQAFAEIADRDYIDKTGLIGEINRSSRLPALLIELKWNQSSGGAIQQIREKNYMAALKPFEGNIILCGINYDSKTKKHTCSIERA